MISTEKNMINKILKPVFSSADISPDLIFINCSLGYDGNINLLFADKKYDNTKTWILRYGISTDGKNLERVMKKRKARPETAQDYRLIILGNENKIIEFNKQKFNYTHGLQADVDTYCFLHPGDANYSKALKDNLKIVNEAGKITNALQVGYGIIDIQTNSNHELWVSYADIGIFNSGTFSVPPNIETKGLNCFDIHGNIIYTYNGSLTIADANALNVVSENEVFLSIYSGHAKLCYALGKITGKGKAQIIGGDVAAYFMAYSNNKILVNCGDYFRLLDIEKEFEEINSFAFFDEKNQRLYRSMHCKRAQKDKLFFWKDNMLYMVSIDELV
jgi:hypothetical protein